MNAKKATPTRKSAASKKTASKKTAGKKAATKKAAGKKTTTAKTSKSNNNRRRRLHLISDFTGNLANHMVASVLSQFPDPGVETRLHIFVDDLPKLEKALRKIRSNNDLVLHAVVDPQAKKRIHEYCKQTGIACHDLTGALSDFFSTQLSLEAHANPERLHQIDSDYFRRIDAMEFTLQHDDSRRLESIDQADIVLLGISRVSKSPTSTFLGSLGFRTANVSISPDLGLPKELKACRKTVCALTMQPAKLYEIRQRRFVQNRFAEKLKGREELQLAYLNPRDVAREVMDAERLYRKAGFPIVDVTGMTIEESAAHVIQELGLLTFD